MKIFRTEEGQGVSAIDPATQANAQRIVVEADKVTVYEHGDTIPEHHTHEAMTRDKTPAKKKR